MAISKYKQAGVDLEASKTLVDVIKPFATATDRKGSKSQIGGFGGLFDLKAEGFKDPVLVSSCDGVGTKILVAGKAQKFDTIGIDLVAMCVNDLLVQGAEPLFLLDYIASGRLDVAVVRDIIAGVAQGCRIAGCALLGGETAEMPSLYSLDDYDIAGFSVGAVERENIIDGSKVKKGDVIIGLPSDGLHSNGFSLVRKVIADEGLEYDAPAPFMLDMPLGDALLAPTKIYTKMLMPLIREQKFNALAHITGGGLTDNIPRVLPESLCAEIDLSTWRVPTMFQWIASSGDIDPLEMLQTFNCGIGMVAIIDAEEEANVVKHYEDMGEKVFRIGTIVDRQETNKAIQYENVTPQWLA